jgi:hypothetical protein
VPDLGEPDQLEHLVNALPGDGVGPGQEQEVVERRAPPVHGARLEQGTAHSQRVGQVGVRDAVDRGGARRRAVQAGDQTHGGRLPGAVRAEAPGRVTGLDREGQVMHGELVAVPLAQIADLDHRATGPLSLPARWWG